MPLTDASPKSRIFEETSEKLRHHKNSHYRENSYSDPAFVQIDLLTSQNSSSDQLSMKTSEESENSQSQKERSKCNYSWASFKLWFRIALVLRISRYLRGEETGNSSN